MSGGKKALLGSALRELTSVLGGPAGAGGLAGAGGPAGAGGKINRVVGSILSLALDNNANGLFAQPQGIFDFGKRSGWVFLFWSRGGEEKKKEEKNLGNSPRCFFFFSL